MVNNINRILGIQSRDSNGMLLRIIKASEGQFVYKLLPTAV
jgi:hypothetical protein